MQKLLTNLGGDPLGVKVINHKADPVGRLVGANPPSGGTIPAGSSFTNEVFRAATGQPDSAHNCGPSNNVGCLQLWGGEVPSYVPIQTIIENLQKKGGQ
jgi:filamentous hemagglutinin